MVDDVSSNMMGLSLQEQSSSSNNDNDETTSTEEEVQQEIIPFSTIYFIQAKAVDGFLKAIDYDLLPEKSIGDVLGTEGEHGNILYGAFQTLRRHGRVSRNMLEQAMCYGPTSYRESVTRWILSLPPRQRSMYTDQLVRTQFKLLQWETDPTFPEYYINICRLAKDEDGDDDDDDDTLGDSHGSFGTIKRTKPVVPLGDNRHNPLQAKAAKLAQQFYSLFKFRIIFDGPESRANMKNLEGQDPRFLEILRRHGSLFGIDSPELPWDDDYFAASHAVAAAGVPEAVTVSEVILHAWNVLFFNDRVSVTELETSLVMNSMREYMTNAVQVALSAGYDGVPFAKLGRQWLLHAYDFLRGDNSSLQQQSGEESSQAETFQLVFQRLVVDHDDNDDDDDYLLLECDYCGETVATNKICSRCHTAMYCNRDCQKKDWIRHKQLCPHN